MPPEKNSSRLRKTVQVVVLAVTLAAGVEALRIHREITAIRRDIQISFSEFEADLRKTSASLEELEIGASKLTNSLGICVDPTAIPAYTFANEANLSQQTCEESPANP